MYKVILFADGYMTEGIYESGVKAFNEYRQTINHVSKFSHNWEVIIVELDTHMVLDNCASE